MLEICIWGDTKSKINAENLIQVHGIKKKGSCGGKKEERRWEEFGMSLVPLSPPRYCKAHHFTLTSSSSNSLSSKKPPCKPPSFPPHHFIMHLYLLWYCAIIFPRTHTFSRYLNSACLEDKSFIFCYFMFFSQGLLRIHIPPTRCSISRSWFVTTVLIQFVKIFFPCSFEIQLSNNPFQKSSFSAFSLSLSPTQITNL